MEPDFRIESNKKGYCNRHFSMIFANQNKLSLALVLETHLEEIRSELSKLSKDADALLKNKGGIFKKGSPAAAFSEKLCNILDRQESSCIICDKIEHTMTRYINIMLEMWDKEPEFKVKVENSKGLCLPHYKQVAEAAVKKLSPGRAGEFLGMLAKKQEEELARIQEDIHKFTLKFDYRNQDMEWGTAKDSPVRTIEKISGNILKDYD